MLLWAVLWNGYSGRLCNEMTSGGYTHKKVGGGALGAIQFVQGAAVCYSFMFSVEKTYLTPCLTEHAFHTV